MPAPPTSLTVRHDVSRSPQEAVCVTPNMSLATLPASRFLRALHQLPCWPGRQTLRSEWQRLPPSRVRNPADEEARLSPVASTLLAYKGLVTAGVSSTALSSVAETSSRLLFSSALSLSLVCILLLLLIKIDRSPSELPVRNILFMQNTLSAAVSNH